MTRLSGAARAVLGRVLRMVLVVLGAATAAFVALHVVPGDPVRTLLGDTGPSAARVEQVRRELGLDRPLVVQYLDYLGGLLRGDLGRSYQLDAPVSEVLSQQVWPTVALALSSVVLALAAAVPLALATAARRPWARRVSSVAEIVAISTPNFWVGVLLLSLFSFRWHLFPVAGGTGVSGLVLPAVALALGLAGVFAQVLRDGVERALDEPFAVTARARGASESAVRFRHALRHASIPMVTLSGWTIGALLSGAVVVETVFSRQGLGRVLATAITSRDMPVVSGVVVFAAAVFAVLGLATDALYPVVDPRLRERVA